MFKFGKNWENYSDKINKKNIIDSLNDLKFLLRKIPFKKGFSFIDIGCGSGVHSIAASKLGFKVTSTDRDKICVKTTKRNYLKFHNFANNRVFQDNILNSKITKKFDIVYSWGVLHHTGNLTKALNQIKKLVKKDGYLIISLYKKTESDKMWFYIKKKYNQKIFFRFIINLFFIPFYYYISKKKRFYRRGQDWYHDAIDWLGGFPYETIDPDKMKYYFKDLKLIFVSRKKPMKYKGFFGSECAEYIFKKNR